MPHPLSAAMLCACLTVPALALAQNTVPVEDAPFAEAGDLAARIDAETLDENGLFQPVSIDEIDPATLFTARVVSVSGDRIGGITGLIEDDTGVIGLVLQAGGVLGLGGTPVALPLHAVRIGHSEELAETRVFVGLSAEELKKLPPYDPAG